MDIGLVAERITWKYTKQNPDGSIGDTVTTSWDFKNNKAA